MLKKSCDVENVVVVFFSRLTYSSSFGDEKLSAIVQTGRLLTPT
jgi:hypothetical protein